MRNPLVGLGAIVLLFVIVFLIASLSGGSSGNLPAEISVQEAYQKYQQGVFLLDVRRPDEWDMYHVANTVQIPLDELSSRLSELPKDQPIMIICHSGNRSGQAQAILAQAGFNATSVAGGMIAWNQAGYPLEGPQRP
ncbi:MAG: rhodanese-like domain-containing protein [Chloroflexi bacterium]|nr:rhodanese-like domain-containing protein [Chloroflexota bacterium]